VSNLYTTTESPSPRAHVVAESPGVDAAPSAIVVASLRGDPGHAVLDEAVCEAVFRGTRDQPAALHVVSFVTDQSATPGRGESAEAREIARQLEEAGIEYRVYGASAEPVDQVLGLVEATRAQLLAISVRKRSPMMKLFLGSVAQQLILEAPCPVLAVK
jgi:nucleotide-binding universal stress UspA family protein